jgi:hypothetical protein
VAIAELSVSPAGPLEEGKRCGVCQTAIVALEPVGRCPRCEASHHGECWNENGGCSSYGCELAQQSAKEPAALPQSYWGQEEKQCPRCAKSIKVAALRCRFCGAVFEDRAPEGAQAKGARSKMPLAILIAGLIPPTAPLALLGGGLWALASAKEARLKGFEQVMLRLGLIAAGITTLVLTVALILKAS